MATIMVVIAILAFGGMAYSYFNLGGDDPDLVDAPRRGRLAGAQPSAPVSTLIACPDCGREVSRRAPNCPGCGSPIAAYPATTYAPPRFNPGIAALLSLIIPGAGQMYKGHVVTGLVWFVFVAFGYVAFIFPGVFLHLICILRAATADA